MNKRTNIVWGLTFILGALLVIFSRLGYFETIGIPTLIITIGLIPIIIFSITSLSFAGILFPLAVLGILFKRQLGIEALTPWPILIAALLLTMGLTTIFPQRKGWGHRHGHVHKLGDGFDRIINEPDSSDVVLVNRFAGSVKYVNTQQLQNVNIEGSFGGMKVYFDHADIEGDKAFIHVDLNFSGVELFFPRNWKIVDDVDYMLGGSEEKGIAVEPAEKVVVIDGKASFSGITIWHI